MNSVNLDPVFPWWTVLPIGSLLLFFLWRESKRKIKYSVLRIVALTLVFVAILGLMLRPSYQTEVEVSGVVILTPDYKSSSVDSLLRENKNLKVLHTEGAASYRDSKFISYAELPSIANQIRFVAGSGLPPYALNGMSDIKFTFIPGEKPFGITAFYVPEEIVVNQKQMLTGVFEAKNNTTLRLMGTEGVEDSLRLNEGRHNFQLSFLPKQVGKFVYQLEIRDNENISTEPVPLDIKEEQQLKILFLQKYPTAEMRTLKNLLSEKGHALVLRYQVSKEDFRYEYANTSNQKIKELSGEVLKEFDLAFFDETILKSLSGRERTALINSVQQGLGMITLLNDTPKGLDWILPIQHKPSTKDTVKLYLNSSRPYTLPVSFFEMVPNSFLYPVQSRNGKILSGFVFLGNGKVSFQLLQETYRIQLEGNESDYTSIWSDLISTTARPQLTDKIKIKSFFPFYSDEPLSIDVISKSSEPKLRADESVIPLTEDITIDQYWHGKSWAGKPGWHQLQLEGDSIEHNYFVSSENEWKSLRKANTIAENINYQSPAGAEVISHEIQTQQISPLLFFLLFLLSYGFLWLAPKL